MNKSKYKIGTILFKFTEDGIKKLMINRIEIRDVELSDNLLGDNKIETTEYQQILYRLATERFSNEYEDVIEERIDNEFFTNEEQMIKFIQQKTERSKND